MAIKVNLSFKENSVDDVILYNFLDEKSKIIFTYHIVSIKQVENAIKTNNITYLHTT